MNIIWFASCYHYVKYD